MKLRRRSRVGLTGIAITAVLGLAVIGGAHVVSTRTLASPSNPVATGPIVWTDPANDTVTPYPSGPQGGSPALAAQDLLQGNIDSDCSAGVLKFFLTVNAQTIAPPPGFDYANYQFYFKDANARTGALFFVVDEKVTAATGPDATAILATTTGPGTPGFTPSIDTPVGTGTAVVGSNGVIELDVPYTGSNANIGIRPGDVLASTIGQTDIGVVEDSAPAPAGVKSSGGAPYVVGSSGAGCPAPSPSPTTTPNPTPSPSPSPTSTSCSSATTAVALSLCPVAEDPSWRNHVIDPPGPFVYPTAVTVSGSGVQNPGALEAADGSATCITATSKSNPTLTLDLGIDTGGHIEVGITQTDGTAVDLAYSERKTFLSASGDTSLGSFGNDDDPDGRTDKISPTTANEQWVSPGIRGGERWILLSLDAAGAVCIDYVRVHRLAYQPTAADYSGYFLSSDTLVNKTWYASAYTFNLSSVSDAFTGPRTYVLDGAKRDREIFTGDLGLSELTGFDTMDEGPAIVKTTLTAFGCQQQLDNYVPADLQPNVVCPQDPGTPAQPPNPVLRLGSYTAWYIVDVYEYFQLTADTATVQPLLPVMERAAQYLAQHSPNGLYAEAPGEFNWHPLDVATGISSDTNVVYYAAMRDLASLERTLGGANGPANAATYDQTADTIQSQLVSLLWDASAGAFKVNTDDPRTNHPEDANAKAGLFGVLSPADASRALDYISQHLETPLGPLNGELAEDPYMGQYISPYESSWELLARFAARDGSGAMDLLRREFGYLATSDPASTIWEQFMATGEPNSGNSSLAHAWSTGPVPALDSYVLGIRPTSPGYTQWLVEPQTVDLQWAQGQVPTPNGTVVSRWTIGSGGSSLTLTAGNTSATTGEVAVPTLGADRVIAEDGQIVWDGQRPVGGVSATSDGTYVRFDGLSGIHTWAWAAPLQAQVTEAPWAPMLPVAAIGPVTAAAISRKRRTTRR